MGETMNKLMGFYELQAANLPAIPWREYTGENKLSKEILWTVRTAVFSGNDLNLPRLVGVTSDEATVFANKLFHELGKKGIVIYYPYFIAKKSGTLNVYKESVVIEAVKDDLWNLVTFSDREITIRMNQNSTQYDGNVDFLSRKEQDALLDHIPLIRKLFRDEMTAGESILIEWSYAYNCNLQRQTVGEEYLVFYEMRTVK